MAGFTTNISVAGHRWTQMVAETTCVAEEHTQWVQTHTMEENSRKGKNTHSVTKIQIISVTSQRKVVQMVVVVSAWCLVNKHQLHLLKLPTSHLSPHSKIFSLEISSYSNVLLQLKNFFVYLKIFHHLT